VPGSGRPRQRVIGSIPPVVRQRGHALADGRPPRPPAPSSTRPTRSTTPYGTGRSWPHRRPCTAGQPSRHPQTGGQILPPYDSRNIEARGNAGNLGWFGWFTAGLVAAAAACSTVSSAAAGATDGRWLGRPYDDDGLGWERHWLGPGAMLGALDAEVAHLALDHAREGAQPAGGQQPLGNLAGDGCQRLGRRLRGGWPPGRRW
jgi:hypothetical protein